MPDNYEWTCDPRVGDTLRALRHIADEITIGSEGTVVHITHPTRRRDDWCIGVDFPGWNGGNNVGGYASGPRSGYYLPREWFEPAGEPKFYLVRVLDRATHGKAFQPIENSPTFSDGKRAAEQARILSERYGYKVQPRPIAGDADDRSWREREKRRLTDGTYLPMPEGWTLEPIPDHFVHLSVDEPKKISYTESPVKGVLDRQVRVLPGRYLEKFYADLPDLERKRLIALIDKPDEMFLAHKRQEIESVYLNGPDSCMSKARSNYLSSVHPVKAYANGDLAIAYLKGSGSRVSARVLVWPEKKIYGRIYGDEARLQQALESEGYKPGGYDRSGTREGDGFHGARLKKIVDAENGDQIVFPYFDGYYHAIDEEPDNPSGTLRLVSGSLEADIEIPPGQVALHIQGQRGFVLASYRWCPKLKRIQDARRFVAIHGRSEQWSLDAVERYCVRVRDKETGSEVWALEEDCVVIQGKPFLKGQYNADDYFLCALTRTLHPVSEKVLTADGRKAQARAERDRRFVCAGNGQTYYRNEADFVDIQRDGRTLRYSFAYLRAEGDRVGVSMYAIYERLARGERLAA